MYALDLDRDLAVTTLIQLLEVYTPPGEERRLERTWSRICMTLGYNKFWRDEVGNFFASIGRGGRAIYLVSHVDTVPGELRVRVSEGKIYGRGAVDAKSSVASMLLAGHLLHNRLQNSMLVVAGLVDEENRGRGAKKLVDEGIRADHIIIGEPTNLLGVATSYRGSISVKVRATAKGGHSSAPYMAESALEKILNLWSQVRQEYNGSRYEEITSALTTLHGGDWASRLPDTAEGTINIRFPPPYVSNSILEKLNEYAARYDCRLELLDVTEPVSVNTSNPVVKALIRSMLRLGLRPRIVKKTGTSDMNTLYNITTSIAACGPGNSLLAHTEDEFITVEDLLNAVKIYTGAVLELDRLSSTDG
ncbi:MAG: M20/M25/M40 family metallo-hydrolase [Nitrososphaerota archaeon]